MRDAVFFLLNHYEYSQLTPITYNTVILYHNEHEVRATELKNDWLLTCNEEVTICKDDELLQAIHFIIEMARHKEQQERNKQLYQALRNQNG